MAESQRPGTGTDQCIRRPQAGVGPAEKQRREQRRPGVHGQHAGGCAHHHQVPDQTRMPSGRVPAHLLKKQVGNALGKYKPTNQGGQPTLRFEQNHCGRPTQASSQHDGNHADAAVHRRVSERGESDRRYG
jgi:hypothetical protein